MVTFIRCYNSITRNGVLVLNPSVGRRYELWKASGFWITVTINFHMLFPYSSTERALSRKRFYLILVLRCYIQQLLKKIPLYTARRCHSMGNQWRNRCVCTWCSYILPQTRTSYLQRQKLKSDTQLRYIKTIFQYMPLWPVIEKIANHPFWVRNKFRRIRWLFRGCNWSAYMSCRHTCIIILSYSRRVLFFGTNQITLFPLTR